MTNVILMLAAALILALAGCSNWQGAEFRVGFGSYNGAKETRTYDAEKDTKK